jgi:cob(I)alamin adenosyltransferase
MTMSKIYTKTGDQGETGLIGGQRVTKDSTRVEACGAVDELNATLGIVRSLGAPAEIERLLEWTQHELFAVGARLAATDGGQRDMPTIGTKHVVALETAIDQFDQSLPALTQFILPAGSPVAAHLHLARTVCRRAERRVVRVAREHGGDEAVAPLVVYLNRLGDLLFVLARSANAAAGHGDVHWQPADR